MTSPSLIYWAALNFVPGLGAAGMLRLVSHFGSPQKVLAASPEQLLTLGKLSADQAEQIGRLNHNLSAVKAEIVGLRARGIKLVTMDQPNYPQPLLALNRPPPLLYFKGKLPADYRLAVAIVGTREPDAAGRQLAFELARGLCRAGWTIVSGLARGIDTAAHQGCLQARRRVASERSRTIAVLGSGLERIYPPENRELAEAICRRGALISEVPPWTPAHRGHLLARDRIQAGLSRAVVVVQATERCGSLVTAAHASKLGRLVFYFNWPAGSPFRAGMRRLKELRGIPLSGLEQALAVIQIIAIGRWPLPDPKPHPLFSTGD